jgi:light-regulated signal transduction histidine kinase (bacteriophytochrome)
LRAISGFIGIALEDCRDGLGAAGIDLLGRVNERTRYMDRLIEALMLLYRSDQSNLAIETVDLAEIAREEISQLQAREPGRKVEWLVAAPLVAEADRRLISNVLANLIGNAWKFTMYRDTARIEIGALQQAGEKVFYVRDNGAGFDAAAGGLFQPLRRLHSSKDFPGYGIGLASAKKIIERHRGRIWAEAAVDRGAAIYFSLGRAGAVLPAD